MKAISKVKCVQCGNDWIVTGKGFNDWPQMKSEAMRPCPACRDKE